MLRTEAAKVGSGRYARIGALLLMAAVGAWYAPRYRAFAMDDAYIHLAYARCIAESKTICFNAGEPSLGTSSLLWVILLQPLLLFHRVAFNPYWAVVGFNYLSFAALTVLTARVTTHIVARFKDAQTAHVYGFGAAMLLVLTGDLHWMAYSGMEAVFLLALSLACVAVFLSGGFGVTAGILCGIAMGTRIPAVTLPVAFTLAELLRRRSVVRGWIGTVAAFLPFALISLAVGGSVVPTSAGGKLLTYVSGGFDVDSMIHFVGRFCEFQKYTPHIIALFAFALIAACHVAYTKKRAGHLLAFVRTHADVVGCGLWPLLHFGSYLWGFRTLGSQGRYLVETHVMAIVFGAVGWAWLSSVPRIAAWTRPVWAAILVAAAAGDGYWRRVLWDNVGHVATVFVPMAEWVRDHTPTDARIAAFDIGVLKYISNRYVLDVGGLLDPKSHACLRERSCGEYVREHGATHILYSREPDADWSTGLFQANHGWPRVLKQTPLVEYRYPDFQAPTLIHSLRLSLSKIDGWYARTPEELKVAFTDPTTAPPHKVDFEVDDALDLTGYSVDTDSIHYMAPYPYAIELSLHYRVKKQPTKRYWVHVLLVDPTYNRVIWSTHNAVTEDLLRPGHWPEGAVRDMLTFYVPYDRHAREWELRVTVDTESTFDDRYFEAHRWVDIGPLTVVRSKMRALAPQ